MTDKRPGRRLGWGLFTLAAANELGGLGLQLLARRLQMLDEVWVVMLIIAVRMWCFGIPAMYIVTRRLPDTTVDEPECPGLSQMFKWLLFCLGLAYVGSLLGAPVSRFMGQTEDLVGDLVGASGPILTFLIVCVVSPLAEEVAFRGILLKKTLALGEKNAVLFTSVAFGLMHMNFQQMFYAILAGLLLGHIAVRTGTIKYTFILHGALNFVGSMVMPKLLESDGGAMAAGAAVLLLIFVGAVAIVRSLRCPREPVPPTSEEDPDSLCYNLGFLSFFLLCLYGFLQSVNAF